MATELNLIWNDETIETVLDALTQHAQRNQARTAELALRAREDIEMAELRTARLLNQAEAG